MASVKLTPALAAEYRALFDSCAILPARAGDVEAIATRIVAAKARYEAAGKALGIPWYFIGAVHSLESSLSFATHLHNGDPLTKRTTHVPKDRPLGNPPFTWEVSATDALKLRGLDKWKDWSLSGLLYALEGYNGFGYRLFHPEVKSPYLWSFSNHYTSGKYVADGTWSPTAKSGQCGAAVLLRRMAERHDILFDAAGNPVASPAEAVASLGPMVRFSNSKRSDLAAELQTALNRFPGIFVRVDGVPGTKTSDAFHAVTGRFLLDDPRG